MCADDLQAVYAALTSILFAGVGQNAFLRAVLRLAEADLPRPSGASVEVELGLRNFIWNLNFADFVLF